MLFSEQDAAQLHETLSSCESLANAMATAVAEEKYDVALTHGASAQQKYGALGVYLLSRAWGAFVVQHTPPYLAGRDHRPHVAAYVAEDPLAHRILVFHLTTHTSPPRAPGALNDPALSERVVGGVTTAQEFINELSASDVSRPAPEGAAKLLDALLNDPLSGGAATATLLYTASRLLAHAPTPGRGEEGRDRPA